MASAWVYFQADGSRQLAATRTHQAARAMANPGSLFVYGGDVYDKGTDPEFAEFDGIYAGVLPLLAAIPGNHDWETDAAGYDRYWLARQPPGSRTHIDAAETGPSRHHYSLPLGNGWLGVFVDCGPAVARTPPTAAALARIDGWLAGHGSRRIIVFIHHARLSRGGHHDNTPLDPLWQLGFDAAGRPRVAAWVAGHNHNMAVYSPRSAGTGPGAIPPPSPNGTADGVQIFVNGAGGVGHNLQGSTGVGTPPDLFKDDVNHGFLRIELTACSGAVFQNFSTGPLGTAGPTTVGPAVAIQLPSG